MHFMRIGSNVSIIIMCTKATWQDCESARGLKILPTNLLNVKKGVLLFAFRLECWLSKAEKKKIVK